MQYLLKEVRIRTKPSTTSRDTISLQKEQAVTNWMTANLELLAEFQFFSYSYSAVVLTNNLLYNHLFNYLLLLPGASVRAGAPGASAEHRPSPYAGAIPKLG